MTYEPMKKEEMEACVALAARAFENYDFFAIYVPDDKRRPRFLRSMLGVEFQVNAHQAHYFTAKEDGKIVAVAMLRDPHYQAPDEWQYLRAGFWRNLVIGGYRNVAAWYDMDQKAGIPCKKLGGNTWFLNVLTVDPLVEGKGIGSRMLHDCIIPFVRGRGGDALSLYTNSEINRKFYTKNGFKEFHEQRFTYKGKELGSWSYKMSLGEQNQNKGETRK